MATKLQIFNTGTVEIIPRYYYSEEIINRHPSLQTKRITIPNLVFLAETGQGNVLVDAGFSSQYPMGDKITGKIREIIYKPLSITEVGAQLLKEGIKKVSVVFTHLHSDHVSGALSLEERVKVEGFYAHADEIEEAKKFRNCLVYPRGMIKNLDIKPLPREIKEIEFIELAGHTPAHVGFKVARNLILVGDAIETPISLEDMNSPKHYKEDYDAYLKTLGFLRELASQEVLLLSNHDPNIKPTHGNNFIYSEEYYKALERQKKSLEKIIT